MGVDKLSTYTITETCNTKINVSLTLTLMLNSLEILWCSWQSIWKKTYSKTFRRTVMCINL